MSRSRLQKCPILTKQDIKIKAKSCEWMRGFIYLLCERDLNLYLYAIRRFRVRRTNMDSPKLRDHVIAIEGCAFSLSDATDCHRARRLNLQQPVGQNRAGPQTNMISLLFGAIGSLLRWCDIPALWLFIIRIYVRFNPPANTYKCVWRGASRRLNRVVVQAPDPSVQSLWSADDSSRDPPPSFSCTPRHVQLCREKLWTRL